MHSGKAAENSSNSVTLCKLTCSMEFESGIMSILVGVLPSITARKPIAARNKVAQAFEA